LRLQQSHYDLVRCGIALYGLSPAPALDALPAVAELRPALALRAEVSLAKPVDAGERLSYGLRYRVEQRSTIATVPIGYADGVRRRLSAVGGEVLIGGKRRPIAGTVTMDQITIDCSHDAVRRGDEVVLIGSQGNEHIGAEEWARLLDTIGYEIVCGIGSRVPRRYRGGQET
jgi:alanine racemase